MCKLLYICSLNYKTMDARELRIGNWVMNQGLKIEFDENDWDCIINRIYSRTPMDRYEPIPLTEEWLVKFGFKKDKNEYILVNGIRIELERLIIHIDNTIICLIKYVHQLQNLYFCLTSEELTIK